jgi:hypothetical protein
MVKVTDPGTKNTDQKNISYIEIGRKFDKSSCGFVLSLMIGTI